MQYTFIGDIHSAANDLAVLLLQRRLAGYHEFHLRDTPKGQQPNERDDVVVIYAVDEDDLILIGIRIGTHDKLFFKQNHANK